MLVNKGNDVAGIFFRIVAIQMDIKGFAEVIGIGSELPATDGGVARGLERLREGGGLTVAIALVIKDLASGVDHGATGDADGTDMRTKHIGMTKGQTTLHKLVQIRSLDERIAERTNTVRAQIICEQEEDVRFLGDGR